MLPRSSKLKTLILLWLSGVNLRLQLLAIPPLLPFIHKDLDLTGTSVGVLAGLPVFLFAVAAVFGSFLVSWIGTRRALIAGLTIVTIGSALRGVGPSLFFLFSMTFVMGAGVAIMQPVLPVLVREWHPQRMGAATAVYVNGLLVGEIIGASLTTSLMLTFAGGSWELALAMWSLPALLTALAVAFFAPKTNGRTAGSPLLWWPNWRSGQIWRIGLVFGGTSSLYFGANAFLPDYLYSIHQPDLVGLSLTALNAGQLPASLIVLLFADRLVARRFPFLVLGGLGFISVVGVLLSSGGWIVVWFGLIGFSAAFMLILILTLPPILYALEDIHRVSAGIFTIAYISSFLVPALSGVAWDLVSLPAAAFIPILGALVVLLVLSARLRFPGR
jgi:CP family cyanate transporter-like MFS transporter